MSEVQIGVAHGLAPDDAKASQSQRLRCGRGGMDMIGPSATEGQQGVMPLSQTLVQVVLELEPLVAAEVFIQAVGPEDTELDVMLVQQCGS